MCRTPEYAPRTSGIPFPRPLGQYPAARLRQEVDVLAQQPIRFFILAMIEKLSDLSIELVRLDHVVRPVVLFFGFQNVTSP